MLAVHMATLAELESCCFRESVESELRLCLTETVKTAHCPSADQWPPLQPPILLEES